MRSDALRHFFVFGFGGGDVKSTIAQLLGAQFGVFAFSRRAPPVIKMICCAIVLLNRRRPFPQRGKQSKVVFSPFHGDAEIIDAESCERVTSADEYPFFQ